jgi:CRP/FNR family transcriptional regulator, cyclic AMP receptor protein
MPHSPRAVLTSDAVEPTALRPLLARGRWFAALAPSLQAALLGAAQWQRLEAGARLFARGDPNSGLYGVVDGAVRIGATGPDGREAVLGQVETAQWFGEIALFDRGLRTHDADAVVATRLLWVPRERLEALIDDEPLWWRHLGELLAEKIRAVFTGMEELALLPAPARIARRLLAMAEGHGMLAAGLARRRIGVNQAQLGAMLALSRQTVSEVLRDFEAHGWLRRHYGEVELLDIAALRTAGEAAA